MKRLLFICLLFVESSSVVLSQSIMLQTRPEMPEPLPTKHKIAPFVGFSVTIPLFKRYSDAKSKAVKKPVAPYKSQPGGYQPEMPPITANDEDGPIAWEHTGEAMTIYGRSNGAYQYTWTGSGWFTYYETVPQNDPNNPGGAGPNGQEPPRQLKNARKVSKNHCENGKTVFKNMYDAQRTSNKEQLAFVTDRGIFWLSDANNTATTADPGQAWEYGQNPDGTKWFYDNGVITNILSIIHTHPVGSAPGVSGIDNDLGVAQNFGVPIYAIHESGIYKGEPDGHTQSTVSNRLNDAFDCSMAPGMFGYGY